jgi:hypothetical protein
MPDTSLHQTPMLLRYWDHVGGTLAEEFAAVRGSATASPRRLDGVIVPGGERRRVAPTALDVAGKYIIVVQANATALGCTSWGRPSSLES